MAFFSATLNTACRWSKRFAKKNILSIAKVVTFEVTPKFWGMEDLRKFCKERILWKRRKSFPAVVDEIARCSFSIDFCAYSSSFCCIIVGNFHTSLSSVPSSPYSAPRPLQVAAAPRRAEYLWRYPCCRLVGYRWQFLPIIPEEIWSKICSERICSGLFLTYFCPSV